ncbi:dehydrogenase, E1 component [Rhizorhabdus wittichii RW1]|jgi:pyruvate dehydrogenase E1 component alpha subunit|uniref:Dehydrogenase, E1 component n=1 Tax=Rhizorhabdus wittichii (strain DSM 6014 / CCUG 31198 / JCM 15750 / NBRC 105917 / EY 4224 / RW1) TaxID=392499 RepID=A0A9J9H8M4_RHIWR|nr:dehydrogenase, E1 component [Rhizorhabdus wittichii RW1]
MERLVPTATQRLWMYETMAKIRLYEARIAEAYMEGKRPLFNMAKGPLPGEMHLCDGQEPCAVGLSVHLGAEDYLSCHHRSHAQAIAKGVDLRRMTAEIFGRSAGLSGGRGGHMHLFDFDKLFWTSGIIGQNMAPAAGAALARKLNGEAGIAVACIGEGAVNQGAFHEVMNLAAVWKLPFLCIIEDNGWAVSVPKHASTAVPENHVRAAAYGMSGEYVAGNDPDRVFEAVGRAVARARAGEGPSLIEIQTTRLQGHFMGDTEGYLPPDERAAKAALDPLPRYRERLVSEGLLSADLEATIDTRIRRELDDAFEFALAAPEPEGAAALETLFA